MNQVFSTLLVAFLVVFHNVEAKHSHRQDEIEEDYTPHPHHNKTLQERGLVSGLFSSACNFVCGTSGGAPSEGKTSWSIDLTGQASIGVIVAYEGNTNSLAFINVAKQIVVVFTGNKQIFGVFNLQANAGLIVSVSTGLAIYVNIASTTASQFIGASANIFAGIYTLVNVIYANQSSITGLISVLLQGKYVFNLQDFVNKLNSGTTFDLLLFFSGKTDLYNKFKDNFGALFIAMSTSTIVTQGYSFSFGVLNVAAAVLGSVTGVAYGFLVIVQRFSTALDGFVNGNLLYQLFSQVSIYAQGFIAGKIVGVQLLADMTLSFSAAGGAALFAITVNGLITVGAVIKGAIDSAVSIVGEIIGSANIGVGVSFQAGIAASVSLG